MQGRELFLIGSSSAFCAACSGAWRGWLRPPRGHKTPWVSVCGGPGCFPKTYRCQQIVSPSAAQGRPGNDQDKGEWRVLLLRRKRDSRAPLDCLNIKVGPHRLKALHHRGNKGTLLSARIPVNTEEVLGQHCKGIVFHPSALLWSCWGFFY